VKDRTKPGRQRSARRRRSDVVAAFVLALTTGCVSDSANSSEELAVSRQEVASPLGSYLAGRHARSSRDTKSAVDFYNAALAEDPGNRPLQHRTFLLMLAEGRFDGALDLAEALMADPKTSRMAELVLALEAIRESNYDDAERRIGTPPKRGFGALLKPLILAWIEAGRSDTAAAIETLEVLRKSDAFVAFRNYHAALIHDFQGDLPAARDNYEATRKKGGVTTSITLAYGSLLRRLGEPEAAMAAYRQLLERSPENPAVLEAVADLEAGRPATQLVASVNEGVAEALYGAAGALAQERGGEAARIYANLALHMRPDFSAARMLLGEIMERDRRWADAIEIYRKVSKSSPYYWEARIRVATSLDRLDRVDEAIETLTRMTEVRADDSVALITLADLLRARERYSDAAAAYDRALARVVEPEERHWTLFYARGIARERIKEWARAEADFLKALELRPDHPLVLNYLGYSWVEQGRNIDRARKMIEKAVAQRPNDGYIVDSLGWVLYRLADYEGAVKYLERAVELKPQDPVINDHLGDAFWRVGRRLEARFQWQHALALDPEESEIPAIKTKLERGLASVASSDGGG
jgi:tetratricopeptide (TPR) repeat protein